MFGKIYGNWLNGKRIVRARIRNRETAKCVLQQPIFVVGEGNGKPLQSSCLENSMDRAAWRATVYGVLKSWTGGGNGNPLQYSCLENPMDCSIWGHESWTQLSNSAQHIYTIYRLFCSLINTSSCINTFACWQIHTIFITLLITIPLAICMII